VLQDEPKMAYAEEILAGDAVRSFQDLDLRRPLQRALTALSYNQPTPIQAATIPQALKGRDICACSATGTGWSRPFFCAIKFVMIDVML
jgi:ATP-dependent RNA helicase DDX27